MTMHSGGRGSCSLKRSTHQVQPRRHLSAHRTSHAYIECTAGVYKQRCALPLQRCTVVDRPQTTVSYHGCRERNGVLTYTSVCAPLHF